MSDDALADDQQIEILQPFDRTRAERAASAMKVKKERGEVYSRPMVGFDVVDGPLIANDSEQALLARIATLRAAGQSFAKIADRTA